MATGEVVGRCVCVCVCGRGGGLDKVGGLGEGGGGSRGLKRDVGVVVVVNGFYQRTA